MAVIELTNENFDSVVSADGIVLVDCWAGWCRPCAAFAPIYEKVAKQYPDHAFGKLDTQAFPERTSSLGLEHIPSLLVYRDGVQLLRQAGNFNEEALRNIVSQAESIDMQAVRAEIAAQETE